MFNKIIKRSHRKTSKSDSLEPQSHTHGAHESTNLTVNHASRTSEANPSSLSSLPPSLSLAALPSSEIVEILPSLKESPPADRPALFLRKLQICCVFFDFSSTLKSVREKEIKRQTLSELVELVQSGSAKMSEWMQQEMVSMIAINLFRCLPPASYENTGFEAVDPEEDEPYLDPSWPHLQLLYELLLRYVVSGETDNKVAKRYVDHVFVLKLLNLFDSEDPREREYLKTILHRIYGKFMVHRPFIRTAISNVFYRFIFETERHSGIGELLEILGSIINGFALPMKQEHKLFLVRALIPLHKPKAMSSYHQQLSYCVIQFVEKDYRLADVVIRGLLKYWPITNCQKEILFLGELEEVLEGTHSAEFQCCIVPLFRQIGRCLNSPHFQVAERALFLWNNEHVVSLIAQNRELVFPIIFEPLERNIQNHWNQAIHGLTSNVQKLFQEMDSQLFEECERLHSHKEATTEDDEQHRRLLWKRIEEVASMSTLEQQQHPSPTSHN